MLLCHCFDFCIMIICTFHFSALTLKSICLNVHCDPFLGLMGISLVDIFSMVATEVTSVVVFYGVALTSDIQYSIYCAVCWLTVDLIRILFRDQMTSGSWISQKRYFLSLWNKLSSLSASILLSVPSSHPLHLSSFTGKRSRLQQRRTGSPTAWRYVKTLWLSLWGRPRWWIFGLNRIYIQQGFVTLSHFMNSNFFGVCVYTVYQPLLLSSVTEVSKILNFSNKLYKTYI